MLFKGVFMMKLSTVCLLAWLVSFDVACAATNTWAMNVQAASPTTRAVSLSDLGMTDAITLTDASVVSEQHFFFNLPRYIRLQNVHLDFRAVFARPFSRDAVLSFKVNGVPVARMELGGDEAAFSRPITGDGKFLMTLDASRAAREMLGSIPLYGIDMNKGFVDLTVVLDHSAAAQSTQNLLRNSLSIDPQATGLVYSFAPESVSDVRSVIATLPHRPLILLPQSELTVSQYEAALRSALALSQKDFQPEFLAIPKLGEWVATTGLRVPDALKSLPPFMPFASAVEDKHAPLKITSSEQIGAWLVLRASSERGLAQLVIDASASHKAIDEALAALARVCDEKTWNSQVWQLPVSHAAANLRVATLAGQAVLVLDEPNVAAAAALFTSTWLEVANSQEALLDKALLYHNDELDKTHFYFAQSQSVKEVSKQAEWVVPFKLADLPAGKWPESFEINLLAAPTGDRVRSVVSVYLNDNLLTSDFLRSNGQFERVTARIPLYSLSASNYLKVEVRRRCEATECAEATQSYPVQLLPSSYLALGAANDAQQFFMLSPQLGQDAELILPRKYLHDGARSLAFVQNILSGLSARTAGLKITFSDKEAFTAQKSFIAFEVAPESSRERVKTHSGRLLLRNNQGKVMFDATGMGSLATVQLLESSGRTGVFVHSVGEKLVTFSESFSLTQGDFAVLDAQGAKLTLNLTDPNNELQLEQHNQEVTFLMSRNRAWLIALLVLLLLVGSLYGLRMFFQRRLNLERSA